MRLPSTLVFLQGLLVAPVTAAGEACVDQVDDNILLQTQNIVGTLSHEDSGAQVYAEIAQAVTHLKMKVYLLRAMSTPEEQAIQQILDNVWVNFDYDLDGHLDKQETKNFLKEMQGGDISDEAFYQVFEHLDTDRNGYIEKPEMAVFIKHQLGATPDEQTIQEKLDYVWLNFDSDQNGHLDKEETKNFLDQIQGGGDDFSDEDLYRVFRSLDTDQNGYIERPEMAVFINQLI